jgi:hypothetical protein
MTETLLYLDVHSYPYVGLSEGYVPSSTFCSHPEFVERIHRVFNKSGLTAAIGMPPPDVGALQGTGSERHTGRCPPS